MSLRQLGMGVGVLSGSKGHLCTKEERLFLDRSSASVLSTPAMCSAQRAKWYNGLQRRIGCAIGASDWGLCMICCRWHGRRLGCHICIGLTAPAIACPRLLQKPLLGPTQVWLYFAAFPRQTPMLVGTSGDSIPLRLHSCRRHPSRMRWMESLGHMWQEMSHRSTVH